MVHISRSRSTMYSSFELDVWGYYGNNSPHYNIPKLGAKLTSLFHFSWSSSVSRSDTIFIYSVDVHKPQPKKRSRKWRFVFIRMLKYFYMSVSHSQFSSYGRIAMKQEGVFVSNYLFFLEGSLASVLYRMNFVLNIFMLRQFITYGHVLVGVRVQTFLNFNVGICEAVRVQPHSSSFMAVALISRLKEDSVYFYTPRYMFVNYQLMFGFLHSKPGEYDVAFPMGIDVYSGMDHI